MAGLLFQSDLKSNDSRGLFNKAADFIWKVYHGDDGSSESDYEWDVVVDGQTENMKDKMM